MPTIQHHNIKAIFFVCLGWLCFAVADGFSKYLVQFYPVTSILFINGVIGVTLSLLWMVTHHNLRQIVGPKFKLHLLRMVWTTGTSFSVVHALKYLPLADFYGISFLSPFFIALLAFFFLNERLGWRRFAAMAVAFAGVLILAGPQYQTHNVGLVWAFLVPVFVALNALTVRKIGTDEPLPLFLLFPFVGLIILNGTLALTPTHPIVWPNPVDLLYFVGCTLGVIGGLLGFASGFSRASESVVVAPFLYTQMIWGILIGIVFFNTAPTATTLAGAVLIISAGLFSFYREYHLAHKKP